MRQGSKFLSPLPAQVCPLLKDSVLFLNPQPVTVPDLHLPDLPVTLASSLRGSLEGADLLISPDYALSS